MFKYKKGKRKKEDKKEGEVVDEEEGLRDRERERGG